MQYVELEGKPVAHWADADSALKKALANMKRRMKRVEISFPLRHLFVKSSKIRIMSLNFRANSAAKGHEDG
jgi:hypothetical protein